MQEAMIDFDDHFENVVTGKVGNFEGPMVRFRSDPCSFLCKERCVAMSKHVDDGTVAGPRGEAKAVLTELSKHFLLNIYE